MNINYIIDQVSSEYGESIALQHVSGSIDYTRFTDAIKRLARGLAKIGISQGNRIAVMLPNIPQYPIIYYAALRVGAIVVPINTMLKGRELAWLLEDCEAQTFITLSQHWEELSPFVDMIPSMKNTIILGDNLPTNVHSLTYLIAQNKPQFDIIDLDPESVSVIQYTSGFTGRPKGAELTHNNILSNVMSCREILDITSNDNFLAVLPFYHHMGQTLLMNLAFISGATLSIFPKFDPKEIYDHIISGNSSIFVGIPSMFKMLNEQKINPESISKPLRLCICGGGHIDEESLKSFEKNYVTYMIECYTTSETAPVISFNQWRSGRRIGSLGHPLPGVEMIVVNEANSEVALEESGELCVKGRNVMRGYINRPQLSESTIIDGWFHTGDIGRMDINGFFYFENKLYEKISKGGFTIHPTEIELLISCHPDVKDVAVVGIPDSVLGQEIKACIVLKPRSTVKIDDIIDYCKRHIALYKVPAIVRFYKDLPRQTDGRIDRTELKK